ncbi:HpcH/HpaI aldolase/citrate lyase family protein [Nocardioides sp. MAHUQ-72]|uniref:HpcH/HpaI aldolase/citrate lyase family protein n=1 Tax=unclassified Nocardioides TaxID=2615069 RepID=UPI003614EA89
MSDQGSGLTGHGITHLYVPADQPDLIDKALARVSGSLIFDLEDSVAPRRRPEARRRLRTVLEQRHAQHVWVRVSAGAEGRLDVDALRDCRHLDGVWLAKAEDPAEIGTLTAELPASVRVGLVIESAKALLALPDLAALSRVAVLQLGEADLAADLRAQPHEDRLLDPIRAAVVTCSAAFKLDKPVAPVEIRASDMHGFHNSSRAFRRMGFGSRACITPAQVRAATGIFRPSAEELSAARLALDAFDRATREGSGVYRGTDGAMVDAATVRSARQLLADWDTADTVQATKAGGDGAAQ